MESRVFQRPSSCPHPPAAPTLSMTVCSNKLWWAFLEPLWPIFGPLCWLKILLASLGPFQLSSGTLGKPEIFSSLASELWG